VREGGSELETSREGDQGEGDLSEEIPHEPGNIFYLPSQHLRDTGGTRSSNGDAHLVTVGKKSFC